MSTIVVAPSPVPIIRNQPLRSEAPELRLAYDRCGGAGSKGVVELEPKRDEKGETNACRQPNAKE